MNSIKTSAVDWRDEIELVFLPGLDGTGLSYGPLKEAMPENIQVTVVRYPTNHKLSFMELVQCAYEQLPQNRPLVLIAESFSGPVSISLASAFPSHIKGIVFCATFMKFTRRLLLKTTRYIPLAYLLSKPAPGFLLYFVCGGRPFSDRLVPLFRKIEKLVNPEVMSHRIKMLADIDATTDARRLKLPCCYIQGRKDKLIPARCIAPFRKYLPDIVVKTVDGPHGILQAQPEICTQIITEFVKELKMQNSKFESRNK